MSSLRREDEHDYRLPRNAVPERYDVVLAPDLEAARFSGRVAVELAVLEASREVVCHAVELTISSASLRDGTGASKKLDVSLDEENERARFSLADYEELLPGRYVFQCSFEGDLNDKLRGFYRSTFEDPEGRTQTMAATHFESHDARRAFPCWDEPDLKAVFGVTVEANETLFVVSNAPVRRTTPLERGRKRVEFDDTMVMSTYLVCVVVGPLAATEPVDAGGAPLRVVAPIGKGHLAGFALKAGKHAVEWFGDYFALPYPGGKLDLVDVPDFAMGAMENLGCVTFREAYLLCDEETSSIPELSTIASVVEHEIAHMWFGDLVTMRWWNGIWLNEAFATYMSVCCLDDFRPEWRPWIAFGRDKDNALQTDALHTTRAIEFPVREPDEAEAMFDVLTYEKGGNVLRMVEQYLGTERFRAGVRRYLAAHEYSNTETTDLWDAIEAEAGGEPVRALMDSWIFQGGFPLVRVAAEGGELVLTEQPFSYLSEEEWAESHPGEPTAIGRDWLVPLRITERPDGAEPQVDGGPGPVRTALLGPSPNGTETVRVAVGDALPVVNAGGSGTYRLRYEGQLFDRMVANLDKLTVLEKYNLVSDTWAVTLARLAGVDDFLALAKRLKGEDDPNVWSLVTTALWTLDLAVADADRPALEAFVRSLLRPELERVGFEAREGEVSEIPRSRAIFVSTLGRLGGDEEVQRRCEEMFHASQGGGTALRPDIAEAILDVVAWTAGRAEFDQMVEHVRHPVDPIDGERHLTALTRLREPELVSELQELCRTEVRSQDSPYVLRALLATRAAGPSTWRFVVEHFEELREKYPSHAMPAILGGVSRLADVDAAGRPVLADTVREDLSKRDLGGQKRLIDQHLERLEVNVRFVQANRPVLAELLSKA